MKKLSKLARLKLLINKSMPFLSKACPEVEPTRNVSLMLTRIFDRVRANVKAQNPRVQEIYQDKNFLNLIDAVEKMLIYISEKDGHYRGQLAYAFMAITGEIEFAFKEKRRKDATYTTFEFHKWLSEHPTELKKA